MSHQEAILKTPASRSVYIPVAMQSNPMALHKFAIECALRAAPVYERFERAGTAVAEAITFLENHPELDAPDEQAGHRMALRHAADVVVYGEDGKGTNIPPGKYRSGAFSAARALYFALGTTADDYRNAIVAAAWAIGDGSAGDTNCPKDAKKARDAEVAWQEARFLELFPV